MFISAPHSFSFLPVVVLIAVAGVDLLREFLLTIATRWMRSQINDLPSTRSFTAPL